MMHFPSTRPQNTLPQYSIIIENDVDLDISTTDTMTDTHYD